jgi:hypothetical protein
MTLFETPDPNHRVSGMQLRLKPLSCLRLIFFGVLLSACVASSADAPSVMATDPNITPPGRSYLVTTSNEVARIGETSQRFEIRHGDCHGWDCENDRRRIEIGTLDVPRGHPYRPEPGDVMWYGWSIYLPTDFVDLSPAGTLVGQSKLVRWRAPLWDFSIQRGALVFKHSPRGRFDPVDCRTISLSQMRGRWTDIVVYADHSLQNQSGEAMVRVWVNGRQMCSGYQPLVTQAMLDHAETNQIYFKYGIYNSYVSRWLNIHGTRPREAAQFNDYHADSGGTSSSPSATPFAYDWGVELPTQVVFYDEVRLGATREDVDIRLIHAE